MYVYLPPEAPLAAAAFLGLVVLVWIARRNGRTW